MASDLGISFANSLNQDEDELLSRSVSPYSQLDGLRHRLDKSPERNTYGSYGKTRPSTEVEVKPSEDSALGLMSVGDAVEHVGLGRFQLILILITGLSTFSDAMEIMLLAVLAPILECEWLLKEYQVALITTVVFLGYLIMCPVWGIISDKYGRRNTLFVVCLWISFYSVLTTFAPTYLWVLILRGCVGAGIAGAAQGYVLLSEYTPKPWRLTVLIGISSIFWTCGILLEIGMAAIILPNVPHDSSIPGWRILIFFSSLPITMVCISLMWLPESARYLVTAGRTAEAHEVMEQAARMNGKTKLPFALKPAEQQQSNRGGGICELLRPGSGLAGLTVGCWILWFIAAFAYYGMVLMSAILFEVHERDCDPSCGMVVQHHPADIKHDAPCACEPPTQETYISMLISTFGELASIVLNMITLDRYGRRKSMAMYLAMQGLAFFLLIPCGLPTWLTTTLCFIIRGLSSAFFSAVYIYVAEVYPTRVRSLGLGSSSAAARIGALLSPFIAQVLFAQNRIAALTLYGIISLFAAVLSMYMPSEPKDGQLAD